MKIVVVGDAAVRPELLEESARNLATDEQVEIVKLTWANINDRKDMQHRALNIEKNGPSAEQPPAELAKEIIDAEILLVHFCPLSEETIKKGKNLRLIGTCRGGMEHVDVDAATKMNIPVIHVIRNAEATSDFAIGLMFAETRNIARGHAALKKGEWRKDYVNSGYTTSMRELTVGIVGLGNIGRLVAEKALGIGMKVIAYDPFVSQIALHESGLNIELVKQEELFKTADIISLHLRLTPQTKKCINASLLSLMKPTAYLINTSRAGVLDKEAFMDALENKKIGGAALDVYWDEPLPADDPLLTFDNLTVTPHNAGNVVDALPKSPKLLVDTINKYWQDGKSDMVVNLKQINK